MAATGKYDLSSGSPEGAAYSNGHRSLYGSVIMERSGSFREASENRISTSVSSMPKLGSALAQSDYRNMLQSILSDLRPLVDQKFLKPLDMKRMISSALGISSDESPLTFSAKLLPSSIEELRRLKNNILESSLKARDRAQAFGEAASKLDKSSHVMSKKRSRADLSSAERSTVLFQGGGIPKTSQSVLIGTASDSASQRLEEKTKDSVPNRRIRSSMVEGRMDARANNAQKPSGLADRVKDAYKMVNGGKSLPEEKNRMLSSAVDGWEKPNMKKKRSVIKADVSSVLPKFLDCDREPRRGMQQKLGNDSRSRMNSNIQGCRSILGNGTGFLGQPDSVSRRPSMRPSPRTDHENSFVLGDRRDVRLGPSDKESPAQRTVAKLNGREDSSAASPTSLTKLNPSARGPRTNSGSQLKVAQNVHRAANSDDMDLPPCTDKSNTVNTSTNRKRSIPTQAAAPPVQWGEQRPQKISRTARRSTIAPFSSNNDELQASGLLDSSPNDGGLAITRRLSSSQQVKVKNEHVALSGLSESDDSGITENKSSKIKKCSEIEEKACQSVPKVSVAMQPFKKTKLTSDEQLGDGIRRQGRSGRGFIPGRSSIHAGPDKPASMTTVKQTRTARGLEKTESKPGRPPTKKLSDQKGDTRPWQSLSNPCLDIAVESEDDHEELLAAANAATQTRNACSSSFWRQMNPMFAFIAADDLAFLKKELYPNVSAECSSLKETDGQKSYLEYSSFTSTPGLPSKCDDAIVSFDQHERETQSTYQTKDNEPCLEQLVQGTGSQAGFSVFQALLSAIIDDEEFDNSYSCANKGEEFLHDHAHRVRTEMTGELQAKAVGGKCWDNSHNLEEITGDGYAFRQYGCVSNGNLLEAKMRTNNSFIEHDNGHLSFEHTDNVVPSQVTRSYTGCSGVRYCEMSINDRILLELTDLGLCPEPVPDLAQSEDEDIEDSIRAFEEKLRVEGVKRKDKVLRIENAVMEAKESQDRELEQLAMDKLVEFAYEKHMACCGPAAAGGKSVNKITKHAAEAFKKRTLARCQKFEETGISCFNEQVFKDIFHSVPSQASDAECREISTNSEPAAATSLTPIQHYDHNSSIASLSSERNGTQDSFSNAFGLEFTSDLTCRKEESWSHKVKKRELLLDDVVAVASGSSLAGPSGIGNGFRSNAKGKRSERERENKGQRRGTAYESVNLKVGRPPAPNPKGERKNKSKLKQKTTNLSASVSENPAVEDGLISTTCPKPKGGGNEKARGELGFPPSCGMEDLPNVDLSSLVVDFGGQGQDIGSWLDIVEDDALQDHDFMGLNIPMDDLSEVNMML